MTKSRPRAPKAKRGERPAAVLAAALSLFASACAQEPEAAAAAPASDAVPVYDVEIVRTYPHDAGAFTQGLLFVDGRLFESTGLNGESTVREVRLDDGAVVRKTDLDADYFGEGLAHSGGRLINLTWRSGTGFVYDLESFEVTATFEYAGEGWGLTQTPEGLVMSDGTPTLRVLDPETFEVAREVEVTFRGKPVAKLNELEWVKGEIFANVWGTNLVLRIDPETGEVVGVVDAGGLLTREDVTPGRTDVLNGVAYDEMTDKLYLTGKRWPKLFEVELVPTGEAR